jgi:diadenylate cyclase
MPRAPSLQAEFMRVAIQLAAHRSVDHILYVCDLPLAEEVIPERSRARRKLVQGVTTEAQRQVVEAMGVRTVLIPSYDLPRHEKFKIALVGGIAAEIFAEGDTVLGLTGRSPTSFPDTLMLSAVGKRHSDSPFSLVADVRIPSPVLEALFSLAVAVAVEGWEGRPVGTLFVLGESAAVMESSRPLTLNPFQGYSEAEKNILNPDVREAIKNFAMLDGAFVIREDGVVLAAGRYLLFDQTDLKVPLGLGARHTAAAGITRETQAIAVAVSETSRKVRMFRGGQIVLEVEPVTPRR